MTTKVNNEACDRCGTCVGVCPANALLLLTASLIVDSVRCTGCGSCVNVCPFGALALVRGPEDTRTVR
jgi:ferredoxin